MDNQTHRNLKVGLNVVTGIIAVVQMITPFLNAEGMGIAATVLSIANAILHFMPDQPAS